MIKLFKKEKKRNDDKKEPYNFFLLLFLEHYRVLLCQIIRREIKLEA